MRPMRPACAGSAVHPPATVRRRDRRRRRGARRRLPDRHRAHRQRRRDPAVAGQADHRVVHRERRHPGVGRGRRQHRHPLVERVRRPAVAPGRPRRDGRRSARSSLQWETAYATAFQIQVSDDGDHLDDDLLHHHRHRRHADAQRHRHRPLRADVRHRPGDPVRVLAVGVPGLRHRRRSAAAARRTPRSGQHGHRVVDRERRHPGSRPPSTATPAPAGRARSATRSGSRSTSAASQTICQVVLHLGDRVRHRVPDPDVHRRHHLDDHLLDHHRHRRHADAHRQRHRPLRADVRHRAGHRVRVLAVGVRRAHVRRRDDQPDRLADRRRCRRAAARGSARPRRSRSRVAPGAGAG